MALLDQFAKDIEEIARGGACHTVALKPDPENQNGALALVCRHVSKDDALALKTAWQNKKTTDSSDSRFTQAHKDALITEYDTVLAKITL